MTAWPEALCFPYFGKRLPVRRGMTVILFQGKKRMYAFSTEEKGRTADARRVSVKIGIGKTYEKWAIQDSNL